MRTAARGAERTGGSAWIIGGVRPEEEGVAELDGGVRAHSLLRVACLFDMGCNLFKKKREKFDFGLENYRDTDLSRNFVTEFF